MSFQTLKHGLDQHISKYIKEQFTLDCWIHFSLHCKNICLHAFLLFPFRVWMRDCGRCRAQVMNDQPWIKYTAITPRQFEEHLSMGQWIYHSIVRGFYQVCFLWCLLIYFTICKSLSESAFDNQWTASFSTIEELSSVLWTAGRCFFKMFKCKKWLKFGVCPELRSMSGATSKQGVLNRNGQPRYLSSHCSDESAWVWAAWCRKHKPCWAPWAMNTHQHMESSSLFWREYLRSPPLHKWVHGSGKVSSAIPLVYF